MYEARAVLDVLQIELASMSVVIVEDNLQFSTFRQDERVEWFAKFSNGHAMYYVIYNRVLKRPFLTLVEAHL
jgi:hypothetical protein